MHYSPLANRVILEEIDEGKRVGSLWVPDIARRNKGVSFGTVIAVGPGRLNSEGKLIPVHVQPGDIVLFPRQAPAVLPLQDDDGTERDVLMLPENDIIAIVHGLPVASGIVDTTGIPLSLNPSSTALPDSVYRNRDDHDRNLSDLISINAPPDVVAEAKMDDADEAV